jgi:hypothetical protein
MSNSIYNINAAKKINSTLIQQRINVFFSHFSFIITVIDGQDFTSSVRLESWIQVFNYLSFLSPIQLFKFLAQVFNHSEFSVQLLSYPTIQIFKFSVHILQYSTIPTFVCSAFTLTHTQTSCNCLSPSPSPSLREMPCVCVPLSLSRREMLCICVPPWPIHASLEDLFQIYEFVNLIW